MCFPVWRELKLPLSPWRVQQKELVFKCAFPFEGNWNYFPPSSTADRSVGFKCAFPFEGNWNTVASRDVVDVVGFKCAFPFEGNWNFLSKLSISLCPFGLNVLSRLKGIETNIFSEYTTLFISLNVLSRLKGIETFFLVGGAEVLQGLNVLSRLKGIETIAAIAIATQFKTV